MAERDVVDVLLCVEQVWELVLGVEISEGE